MKHRSGFSSILFVLYLLICQISFATPNHDQRDEQLPFVPVDDSHLTREHNFTLRHIYHKGSHQYPRLFRKYNIDPDVPLEYDSEGYEKAGFRPNTLTVRSRTSTIQRLSDRRRHTIESLLEAGQLLGESMSLPVDAWTTDKIPGPDVTDKNTVLSFAHMAANAYVNLPRRGDWVDVGGGFNYTEDFGWEADGLRGHIFADTENKTVVIGLKGTSLAFFDGTETTNNDRLNDNLFGSCCCGQGGRYAWTTVCDCQASDYTCNSTCLIRSLRKKSNYYHSALDLYHNVTAIYPDADVWLTGHSLGGVVSSLLGLTFGLPTLTYEAFPDALAARRLGLPTPPGHLIGDQVEGHRTGVFHFGHTADPVYVGSCNSFNSPCTIAGYAFQSKCHTGYNCTYDTVNDLGWKVSIGTHRISSVIKDVIEKYGTTPSCGQDIGCADCPQWSFFESNGRGVTTSSIQTSTSMRYTTITTCRTRGWWGCLDEGKTRTVSMSQTITTSECLTPGWFGCRDPSTIRKLSPSTSAFTSSAIATSIWPIRKSPYSV